MLIDFSSLDEVAVSGMNGGEGSVVARMTVNEIGRFVESRILPGSSIGEHEQATGADINFVVEGRGHAVCDGMREELTPGVCHVCPQGSRHTIVNDGDEDLVLWTVVR